MLGFAGNVVLAVAEGHHLGEDVGTLHLQIIHVHLTVHDGRVLLTAVVEDLDQGPQIRLLLLILIFQKHLGHLPIIKYLQQVFAKVVSDLHCNVAGTYQASQHFDELHLLI